MEVFSHELFLTIKLVILGGVYALVTLLIFRLLSIFKPHSWVDSVSSEKLRFWFLNGALISLSIFIFSTTHWGSHGLGDYARIPLNYGKEIIQINGTQAFIENIDYKHGDLSVSAFATTPHYVVGKAKNRMAEHPEEYFSWFLPTNNIQYFYSKNTYKNYAKKNNLPDPSEFKSFWEHYNDYWNGWRFWMLL